MDHKNDSPNLTAEKKELDLFFSSILQTGPSDSHRDENHHSFNLADEKRELDIFLSSILQAGSSGTDAVERNDSPSLARANTELETSLPSFFQTGSSSIPEEKSALPESLLQSKSQQDEYKLELIVNFPAGEENPRLETAEAKMPTNRGNIQNSHAVLGNNASIVLEHQAEEISSVPPNPNNMIKPDESREPEPCHTEADQIRQEGATPGINADMSGPMPSAGNLAENKQGLPACPISVPGPSSKQSETDLNGHLPQKSVSPAEPSPKNHRKRWIIFGALLIAVIAAAAAATWAYQDKGGWALPQIFSKIPFLDQYLTDGQTQKNAASAQVRLLNVRQRFIYNTALERNIRIIEGTAENQTKKTISRLKVIGELYDANTKMMNAKMSLCGNIVSDEILGSINEEAIQFKMAHSVDMPSSPVPPRGQLPFMIVFTNEHPGIAKATVMFAGFEKSE